MAKQHDAVLDIQIRGHKLHSNREKSRVEKENK